MKTLTALFAATALTLAAGLAQADVRPDHIEGLLKSGAVMPFDKLNAAAVAKHAGAQITDTELDHNNSGVLVYEVELVTAQGIVRELELHASTGEVLKDEVED